LFWARAGLDLLSGARRSRGDDWTDRACRWGCRASPHRPPLPHSTHSPNNNNRLDGTTDARRNHQARGAGKSSKRDGDNTAPPAATAAALGACLEHAAVQLVPFGAQAAASAAAYRSGLVAAQLLGLLLRVSSRTPVLGPCLGALGVGFASTLAGVAARHARKLCTQGGNPLDRAWWEPPRPADAALDCALGVALHRALGGRFSAVMPSDLAKPGARALESLPASADGAYAAPGAKRELARIFRRDGCHHCGTRKGPVIGDHMPPNVYVSGPGPGTPNPGGYRGGDLLLEGEKMLARFRAALRAATGGGGGGGGARRGGAAAAANIPPRIRQRFYAQCQRCSVRQAVAVRTGKRTLVLHLAPLGASRPERAAGLAVGLRQGAPALASDSPVAIVASRVGSAVQGAAESAAAAVREHRERRRQRDEAERRNGGGGKGRGGGGGAAAAGGGGGGWGRGGGAQAAGRGGNGNGHSFAVDARQQQQQQAGRRQNNEQASLAWAAAPSGGARQQQQQQQPQPQAFATAAPVQGGLLAGPLYAEFLAAAGAPGWGSDGGGGVAAAPQQQQQRAVAGGGSGYDAALAAYVSPGQARSRPPPPAPEHSAAAPDHYPPLPLPAQYLSGGAAGGGGGGGGAGIGAGGSAIAAAPTAPTAPGDLSGVVALGPSVEDAKRRAQEAFDRHFARAAGAM
jgi:hypothetical protein